MQVKKCRAKSGESGYMLLAVMLMVTILMIGLALEAPRIGQQIKREKEEELIHRGNEYKSAIRKYFRKFGNYPVSIDQLENTNNMRFLRKRYKDPFTGKDDWHLLHPGEVLATPGTGAQGQQPGLTAGAAGQPSSSPFGQSTAGFGQSTGFGQSAGPGQSAGFGTTSPTATPSPGASPGGDQSASGTTPGGITAASNMPGASNNSPVIGGGPVVGVASISKLQSIKVLNQKDHYNDWQFVYDPRLDAQTTTPGAGAPGTGPVGGINAGPGAAGTGFGGMNGQQTPGTSPQPTPAPTPMQ